MNLEINILKHSARFYNHWFIIVDMNSYLRFISLFPDYPHISCWFLLFCSSLHTPFIRLISLFMLRRIHPPEDVTFGEDVTFDERLVKTWFEEKIIWKRNKKDWTKGQVFQNSSIIFERFSVYVIYHTCKNHKLWQSKQCQLPSWILETKRFC